jgi:hypothetical protein
MTEEGKESASFFEKRSKKLLGVRDFGSRVRAPAGPEVFWFFFSKKNCFPELT